MEKQEFEDLFNEIVANPLSNLGFQRKGKSLYIVEETIAISLIRLGGRMSSPGSISHTLCFRHSFLPGLMEEKPQGFETRVSSYPIKIRPLRLLNPNGNGTSYTPRNLNYDYDNYTFEDQTEAEVKGYLGDLHSAIIFLKDWGEKTMPSKLAAEISILGENAWIEKQWLRAYYENGFMSKFLYFCPFPIRRILATFYRH